MLVEQLINLTDLTKKTQQLLLAQQLTPLKRTAVGVYYQPDGQIVSYMKRRRERAISTLFLLFSGVIYQPECFLQQSPKAKRVDWLILLLVSKVEAGGLGKPDPSALPPIITPGL